MAVKFVLISMVIQILRGWITLWYYKLKERIAKGLLLFAVILSKTAGLAKLNSLFSASKQKPQLIFSTVFHDGMNV